MKRKEAIEEIKRIYPIRNLLQKTKSEYICPYCGSGTGKNKTGALYVYPDNTFYCHVCKKWGDSFDLYQKIHGVDFNTAFSLMATELNITIDNTEGILNDISRDSGEIYHRKETAPAEGVIDYSEYYKTCIKHMETEPEAKEYLLKRGISETTAILYNIGYDPAADPANNPGNSSEKNKYPTKRIIIPVSNNFYVTRAINDKEKYPKLNSKGNVEIFNTGALYVHDVSKVFIVEGAIDALSVIEAGAAAIALNSMNNINILLKTLEARRTDKTLVICLDNDPDKTFVNKNTEDLKNGLDKLNIKHLEKDINGKYKDANEHLQKDREEFIKVINDIVNEKEQTEIDSFLSEIFTEKYKPIPTGIKSLDNYIGGGLIPQTLTLLTAEPGAGKTALSTMIFESMAKSGRKAVYINLEMSKSQLLARSIARIAYLNYKTELTAAEILQGYKLEDNKRDIVIKAAREYESTISGKLLYNPDNIGSNITDIINYLDKVGKEAQEAGRQAPDICLDYLQIVTSDSKEDAAEVIKRTVAKLKEYAIKYNAIVFLISAENRTESKSKEFSMSAARDTSAIEYTADLQLQIKRDKDKLRLGVVKSRFTPVNDPEDNGIEFKLFGGQSYLEDIEETEDLIFTV